MEIIRKCVIYGFNRFLKMEDLLHKIRTINTKLYTKMGGKNAVSLVVVKNCMQY